MIPRTIFGRHYALAVVAIIFVALLAAAGLRSTPGVLMVTWGQAFGWSRGVISLAAATNSTTGFLPPDCAIADRAGMKTRAPVEVEAANSPITSPRLVTNQRLTIVADS